jgi:hypothetical protein
MIFDKAGILQFFNRGRRQALKQGKMPVMMKIGAGIIVIAFL